MNLKPEERIYQSEAMQELKNRVDTLKAEIRVLRERCTSLELTLLQNGFGESSLSNPKEGLNGGGGTGDLMHYLTNTTK